MKKIVSFKGRTFGPPPELCPGPTGGLKAALRRPVFQCAPFRKSWIRHCDFPIYPYVRCLRSIPKVKPTILWWWWGYSTSFATTSSLSLHRILYIPGGVWKWTPHLTNIGPLSPSLKTKSGLSSPLKGKLNAIELSLWKIPGSAPSFNWNNRYPELSFLSSLYTLASI
jgi:hypothetical protein